MTKYAQDMKTFIINKKYKTKQKQYRRTKHFGGLFGIGGEKKDNVSNGAVNSAVDNAVDNVNSAVNDTKATIDTATKSDDSANSDKPSPLQSLKNNMNQGLNKMKTLILGTPEQREERRLKKKDIASKKLSDKIALKSAVSGSPQMLNINEKSSKQSNSRNVVEIVKTSSVILQTFFNIIPMLVYFIALYILAMAYLNIILYIFSIVYYFFRTNDSTILYDTLRYKLLSYASIIQEYSNIDEKGIEGYDSFSTEINQNLNSQCSLSSHDSTHQKSSAKDSVPDSDDSSSDENGTQQYTPEPVFFLFNVNFALVLINIVYTLLLTVFIVCFIVVLIMKAIVPLFNPNFVTDSWDDKNGNNVFTSVATNFYTYVGLIFSIILYLMYRMYFRDFMYKKLYDVKKHISELDSLIFKTLSVGGSDINKDLKKIMDDKKKGNSNGQYLQVNDIIYRYLESGNTQKALQSLFYFTVYSNLHDNIPDTNRGAIEKINKFFFQKSDDLDKSLTYVSLNLNTNGVTEVKKIYMELDIFANKTKYTSQTSNIESLLGQIECKVDELNRKIIELPEIRNTSLLFGVFIVMLFVFCVLFMMSYNLIVIKHEKANNKDSLSFIAKSINNLLIAQFPQLGSYYLAMIYKEESTICSGLARDSSSQFYNSYSKCMSQTVNIKR